MQSIKINVKEEVRKVVTKLLEKQQPSEVIDILVEHITYSFEEDISNIKTYEEYSAFITKVKALVVTKYKPITPQSNIRVPVGTPLMGHPLKHTSSRQLSNG